VVSSLLTWVSVCQEAGEPEEAVRLLRMTSGLAGPDLEPRLKLAIRHNLLISLMDLGRLREAQALLRRSRPLYRQIADPQIQLRMRWVEGQILAGLGEVEPAIHLLERVRTGFVQRGNGYDAALLSLELAALHARVGRPVVARRLAGEAFPIFRSRGVQREALAALILLVRPEAA
jgi:tetratricopeptide (TPR) repeat protein